MCTFEDLKTKRETTMEGIKERHSKLYNAMEELERMMNDDLESIAVNPDEDKMNTHDQINNDLDQICKDLDDLLAELEL